MSLQRFFTRSTFGRFALFMMAGLLCASLSAQPLLAASGKDAPAASGQKTADAPSGKAAGKDSLTDKEKAKLEAEEKAKQEAEEKARLEAEAKAKAEEEAKAKQEAEERARQEAEAAAAKLQAEAEAAQQKSESTASDDAVAAYVREACALGDTASVTVTSADAPSKPVTLKSGDKSVTARYAREKVTVKVVEDVSCIFPLKSLGVKGATDDGWQVHSETSSIRSEIERS